MMGGWVDGWMDGWMDDTCNWVDTRWQQYSTHLHTNNTQNNTISLGRVRAVPRLCVLYLEFALHLRKKHGKTSVKVAEECQLARWKQNIQNRT